VKFTQLIVSLIGVDSVFGIWMSITLVFSISYFLKFLFTGGKSGKKLKKKQKVENNNQ
jgi:hypothetical protein